MGVKQKIQNYKTNVLSTDGLTVREQIGYSGGIFGNCMGQDSVGTYGDTFNRDFLGISNKMLLIKENISTVASFILPPVIGAWYDKPTVEGKKSNISRALKGAPIPFAIASLLLFIVPTTSAAYNFFWALFLGLFFNIADTFFDMAMSAMALKLVQKPSDRKNFYTVTSIASTLGSMLPGWIIPIIVDTTDDVTKQQWLYFFVAAGFTVIGVASMYAPYFEICKKKDLILQSVKVKTYKEEPKISWDRETVKLISHNRPFVILQLSLLFDMIRQVTYTTLPFLYRETFDDYSMKAIIDMISGILSYIGLFSVPVVAKRFSARNILAGGYAYTSFFYLIMSMFNIGFNLKRIRKYRYVIGILLGLAGMPNAAQGVARKILVADSTDYMEWYAVKNGISVTRCDGLLVATQSIVSKINSLIKTNLYNGLFIAIKYIPKDPASNVKVIQTDSTLQGIFNIVSICGLVGNSLAAICLMFDNYTGKRKEKIYTELTEMREVRAKTEE